jgi:hypothetical protein
MVKEVNDFRTPIGATMGELIRATPRDRVSRIFLEEKLFNTWYHGRVVLIGDGKFSPMLSKNIRIINIELTISLFTFLISLPRQLATRYVMAR